MAQQIPQPQTLLASSLAAKANSKYEIYVLLCVEAKFCLPKAHHVTVYFLKDLISGRRKGIKSHEMNHIYVPQYDSLSIQNILDFLGSHPECFDYFPADLKEIKRLPKQWIVNVAVTVLGDPFSTWIKEKIVKRNDDRAHDRNMFVEMDPEIFNAFNLSNAVSTSKGNGANLMKMTAKRRRTKAEVSQAKLDEQNQQQALAAKQAEIDDLRKKYKESVDQAANMNNDHQFVQSLIEKGALDIDDNNEYFVISENL